MPLIFLASQHTVIMQINFGPTGIDIATVANPAYEGHIKIRSNQTEDSLYSDVQGHVGRL